MPASETVGRLDLELSANTAQFIEAFRGAADSVRKSKDDITLNLRAIKLASADLNAQLATGAISHSSEVTARRNILDLAKQTLNEAKASGIQHSANLGALKAATLEIEKQNAGLEGMKGRLSTITSQLMNAVKFRIGGLPGMGSLGGNLAVRAYEPVGKIAEEGAGKLEAAFGETAVVLGGTVAALAAVGAVAAEVTHKMMDLAQSIENTAAATGLSTTQVQEFNELAREMGVDAGSLEMAFARIQSQLGEFVITGKAAGSGSQYFVRVLREMGVALTDTNGNVRPTIDILNDFYDSLQTIPDAATRTATEMGALGTRGRVLAEVFEEARRRGISLRDALKSIDASGAVLTPSELDDLMKAKESWDKIGRAIEGAKVQLGLFVGESLTSLKGFAAGAAAIFESVMGGQDPFKVRKELMGVLSPQQAKSAGAGEESPFASGAEIGRIQEGNEKLEQRLAILRAGGELQLQLNQAQEAFNAAAQAQATAITKGELDKSKAIGTSANLYLEQISDLKEIIALEAKAGDLSKLQAQYAETEHEYTVAAVNGNKEMMDAKARQLAQYDAEIERLQKIKGLVEETAFESLKMAIPRPSARVVPNYLDTLAEVREGRRGSRIGDYAGAKSGLAPAAYYENAGKTLEQQLAPPEIPGTSMSEAAPPMADISALTGPTVTDTFSKRAADLRKLHDEWLESTGQTVPLLEEQYARDEENFRLMFEQKQITAEQFAEAEAELQNMASRKIAEAYREEVEQFGTASQRMKQLLQDVADSGRDFAAKVTESMSHAIDGIESSLARLIVTGKGGFRSLFESIAEEMTKNGIQLGFSKIAQGITSHNPKKPGTPESADAGGMAGALAKIFGGGEHGKPAGTKGNPLYVVPVGALTAAAGSLKPGEGSAAAGGAFSTVSNLFDKASTPDWMRSLGIGAPTDIPRPGGESTAQSSLEAGSSIVKSIFAAHQDSGDNDGGDLESSGGLLSKFGKIFSSGGLGSSVLSMIPKLPFFGGFLEGGGDVTPGRAYVVGEKHPEIFLPRSAGTVIPKMPMGGTTIRNTNVNLNITGADHADSFRRSSSQIFAHLHAQAAGAAMKNK